MRRLLFIALSFVLTFGLLSCEDESGTYDAYADWQARNEAWFVQIADSARSAIRSARQAYGNEWESHCDWRMYKALDKSPTYDSKLVTDSICVRILSRGTGTHSPVYTDSVRVNYRGWLMPTTDAKGQREEKVFDQSYYGTFNSATAAPFKLSVAGVVIGFGTALQYMVEGDEWMVYIPSQLAYGETATDGGIPAFSTIRFRLQLMGIYPKGTTVPEWR